MTSGSPKYRYAVVTPAKDEEAYAERTLESMIAQTVLPVRWVIIDDGSTDRTGEMAETYAKKHPWIEVVHVPAGARRNPDHCVVGAFFLGLKKLKGVDYEYVVKMDMDLMLPADYFENILDRFAADACLGIASGVYQENRNGTWESIVMPPYHSAGASKVMRRKCYEEIGGYPLEIGWDSIDEIRARARGWDTKNFPDLTFKHLRHEGSEVGHLRSWKKNGVAYYMMGGGLLFLLFKTAYRMLTAKPFIFGGLAVLWGYLSCWIRRRERPVTEDEARLYRDLTESRLWGWWQRPAAQKQAESREG
jgi:glycosyltransferase involved in cell wall biosynthesis